MYNDKTTMSISCTLLHVDNHILATDLISYFIPSNYDGQNVFICVR